MDGFTDIRAGGWVRRLPRQLVPYAILARFDRPIGSWLLFLPGFWAILLAARSFWLGLWLGFLFGVGAVVMRGAGCVVNDLWDRKMDARVARTAQRPLASGMLRPVDALVFLAFLLLIGLLILSQLNHTARALGVLSLALVALYPLAKRVTWWPQMVLGFIFSWGAPMGFAAATGHLGWPAAWLYFGSILWVLGYDTIYAHQDREDDALIGVKSTARLFGRRTRTLLVGAYGGAMLALAAAMLSAGLGWPAILALVFPATLLARQILLLEIDNQELCLKLFKSNRDVGLSVALAIIIGQIA